MSRNNKKSFNPIRTYKWRQMYREMHTVHAAYDLYMAKCAEHPNDKLLMAGPALASLGRVCKLAKTPRNPRVRRLAIDIRDTIFDAMIKNDDTDVPYQWRDMGIHARYTFIQRTLMTAHQMYTAKHNLSSHHLEQVKYRTSEDDNVLAEYAADQRTVRFYSVGLNNYFSTVIKTAIHEYVHVLQDANATTLPQIISNIVRSTSWITYNVAVPYKHQPNEKEAFVVSEMAIKDLHREMALYIARQRTQ